MPRAQIETLHIGRPVHVFEANQGSGVRRLVHHAPGAGSWTTVANFHVKN